MKNRVNSSEVNSSRVDERSQRVFPLQGAHVAYSRERKKPGHPTSYPLQPVGAEQDYSVRKVNVTDHQHEGNFFFY